MLPIPDSIQELLEQAVVEAIWKRPELSRLREPIEAALKGRGFSDLLRKAFEAFAERSQTALPQFFDEGFLQMSGVVGHLSAYVVQGQAVDLDALVEQYAKRHLDPSKVPEVRAHLEGYLKQLRETLAEHETLGPILLARDIQSITVALRFLVDESRRSTEVSADIKTHLERIETRLETLLREPEMRTLVARKTGGHVFLSYSRRNLNTALRIRNAVADAGHAIWQDISSIKGGDLWLSAIDEGIKQAYAVVIILSGPAWESYWVREEFAHAQRYGKTIIPVNIDGCETPFGLNQLNPIDAQANLDAAMLRLADALPPGPADGPEHVPSSSAAPPANPRELELAYLNRLSLEYSVWKQLYTPMAGMTRVRKQPERRGTRSTSASITPKYMRERIRQTFAEEAPVAEEAFENVVDAVLKVKHLVILGEPGSGKTTTLWTVAARLVEDALSDSKAPLPVFVRLGGLPAEVSVRQQIQAQLGDLDLGALERGGRLALLIDALNELPAENRESKLPEIRERVAAAQRENTLTVVTCRRLDYERGLDLGIDERADIAPLDPGRIRDFCARYLPENGEGEALFWTMAGEAIRKYWAAWQAEEKGNFESLWTSDEICRGTTRAETRTMRELRDAMRGAGRSRQLLALARNPYMLFMITQVYDETGELPPNRGKLFELFTDILLLEREKLTETDADTLRDALAEFAFTLRRDGLGTSAPRAVAERFLTEQQLYRSLSANLLDGVEEIRFSHELLNEYFAARRLDQELRAKTPAAQFWKPEDWWKANTWNETAILLTGLYNDDATPVIEWLRDANPELTVRCILESGAVTPEASKTILRSRWLPRPSDLQNDPQPEARAAIGRALGVLNLDDRPGVAQIVQGTPVLEWCEVLADEDGQTFTFGEGDKAQQLSIPYTYWIAKYPVTYAQFEAFVDAGQNGFRSEDFWTPDGLKWRGKKQHPEYYWNDPQWHIANHPVVGVTWYEAHAFSRWLDAQYRQSGLLQAFLAKQGVTNSKQYIIRLATEAEWEKAARYPDGRQYPWGKEYISGYANIDETARFGGDKVGELFLDRTTPVGMYPQGANPAHGAHDLSGNVWEWCLTKWAEEYQHPGDNDPSRTGARGLRGGSWIGKAINARAAARVRDAPDLWNDDYVGFRVVLSSPVF